MHNERFDDTLECINEVRRNGEDDPQFIWLEAVSYQKLEQFDESLNSYDKAYNYFKNNEDFLEDFGFFLIEEGDRVKAKEIFTKLLQCNPTNDEYVSILERLDEDLENM